MPLPFLAVIALSFAVTIGVSIAADLLRPKPKIDSAKPASFSDFKFPTADETRAIPYGAGSFEVTGFNVCWSGDFEAVPIHQKIRTGLFSTQDRVRYHHYHIGFDAHICLGPDVVLKEIRVDDRVLWSGSAEEGSLNAIYQPEFLGGGDEAGGIIGYFEWYGGNDPATRSDYLKGQVGGHVPLYNNRAHLVWRGASDTANTSVNWRGYIGNSEFIRNWTFRLERIVDQIGQPDTAVINGNEANFSDVIYELMTSGLVGPGVPAASVDLDSFQAVAQVLYDEGLGCNVYWDNQRPIGDFIDEMLATIGGAIHRDPVTRKYGLILARPNYDEDDLDIFTQDHFTIEGYSHGSYDETTNEVKVPFVYVADNFRSTSALAQDMANVMSMGGVVSETVNLLGVGNPEAAISLAARELRLRCTPLARMTLKCLRNMSHIKFGDVFRIQYDDPDLTISNMIVRVVRPRYGTQSDPYVKLDVVQDVFSIASTQFFTPPISTPTPGLPVPASAVQIDSAKALVMEQPYQASHSRNPSLWTVAARPNADQVSYDSIVEIGTGYETDQETVKYTPTATLASSLARVTAATLSTLALTAELDTEQLKSLSAADVAAGGNLFLLDNEILAYESVSIMAGTVTLTNVYRGLLDTTPEAHSSGARAYFFTYGSGVSDEEYGSAVTVDVKLVSRTRAARADDDTADVISVPIVGRSNRPYPPGNITIAGDSTPEEVPDSGDILIQWNERNAVLQTTIIKQDAPAFTPEPGTTYTVKVYDAMASLVRTQTGITGSSFNYTTAMQAADGVDTDEWLIFRIVSVCRGLDSYQAQTRKVHRTTYSGSGPADPAYLPAGTLALDHQTYSPVGTIVLDSEGHVLSVTEEGAGQDFCTLIVDELTYDILVDELTLCPLTEEL